MRLASIAAAGALAAIAPLALAEPASAQVLYRRPFSSDTAPITAHFDTNGPGGGLADYVCGGRTYDGHTGTDFGIPTGTPVLAAAAGRVVTVMTGCPDVGYLCSPCGGLCGNQVRLQHSDGSQTIYCHMQSSGMRVGVGDTVSCGQTIGHSASSGCSTGPHLHFGFHASASAAADDPFRGACGGPYTRWHAQRAYPQSPGASCGCTPSAETCNGRDDDCDGRVDEAVTRACSTACGAGSETCAAGAWGACSARAPTTEVCNAADDDCDSRTDEGELCEIDLLDDQPGAYAAPRTTDVDGDGLADLCARGAAGVRCWTASATGWNAEWAPIPWADASGWGDVTNYATLRMGDVNGDGLADVCARADAAFLCALSNGSGFEAHSVWRDGISDAASWNLPRFYTTLRLADVDGDGRDDLCARDSQGFGCWISTGSAFERRIEGPRWSDTSGWDVAKQYGTIRMGDVNGDRRADVCARSGAAGMECWLSSGDGFPTHVAGPAWHGGDWGEMSRWSTIRLLDYDGDGRADLCALLDGGLTCLPSLGASFGEPVLAIALGSGWDDRSNYATLRTGDIDGDGADDLCLRSNTEVFCVAWNGADFARVAGPDWSDESGWSPAHHSETIRLADFDGDGRDDVCARAGAGWRCHPSSGAGFGDAITLDELTNAGSWTERRYWSTIMSAGRACRAEMEACNGRDDDCDGEIDEHVVAEICNGADDDCDGEIDEHATAEVCNDRDDDCDGDADEGLSCGVEPSADGGSARLPDGGALPPSRGGDLSGGCACRASGAPRGGAPLALVLLGIATIAALGRRGRSTRRLRRSRA